MPSITLSRVHPTRQREAFENLDVYGRLLNSTDPEHWEAIRTEVTQVSLDPGQIEVEPGSFALDRPRYVNPRTSRRNYIDWVTSEDAKHMVEVATGGILTFNPPVVPGTHGFVAGTSRIEAGAWSLYNNGKDTTAGFPVDYDVSGGEQWNYTGSLRTALETFQQYKRSTQRKQYMRQALRLQMNPPARRERTVEELRVASEKFQEFLSKTRTFESLENPFQYMTALDHGTLSSRTWGIEIEAVDIEGVRTPEGWNLHGDGSLRSVTRMERRELTADEIPTAHEQYCPAINECEACRVFHECECEYRDGSPNTYIENPGHQTETGEWTSPILRSYHSRGLKHLTDYIENRESNDSPGIHVHVAAGDLTPEQAARVAMIYTAWEPMFENEYRRNERHYCQSIDASGLIGRFNSARTVTRARDINTSGRYFTVNLRALSSHGTIEFRAMGPHYNYDKLVKWASFLREIVNIAASRAPQRAIFGVKSFKDVITVMAQYGKETITPEWAPKVPLKDPKAILGEETRRKINTMRTAEGLTTHFDDFTGEITFNTEADRYRSTIRS